jgi:hypothetical protein
MITGANSVGKEMANFAPPKVPPPLCVYGVPKPRLSFNAKAEIVEKTGNPNVHPRPCDLSLEADGEDVGGVPRHREGVRSARSHS